MQLTWLAGKRLLDAAKRIDDWTFLFEGDTLLITECLWRLIGTERILVTSLDHGHRSYVLVQRGGEEEVAHVFRDASEELSRSLHLATVKSATIKSITNDIQIDFDNALSFIVTVDRSNCGAWCLQSPELNIVASGASLAIHTKKAESSFDESTWQDR